MTATSTETTTPAAPPTLTESEKAGALAQERHHFIDLDADSSCRLPGSIPLCPPKGTKAA